jgi:thiocyanate hydrolase subunit alpha/thiocyanate hydrolase subunit beta
MGDIVSSIYAALYRLQDWPYPDQIDHALYNAYMKQPHDVGGESDPQGIFEEKEEEQWDNTFVGYEVLGRREI